MIDQVIEQELLLKELAIMFERLAEGNDLAPAEYLRFEGKVAVLMRVHIIEWPWLKAHVNALYEESFKEPLEEEYWHWIEEDMDFRMPIRMMDAPVYKP